MYVDCPNLEMECPYFDSATGECLMEEMENGADPRKECDAFFDLDDHYAFKYE